jgi:hypothetical protein
MTGALTELAFLIIRAALIQWKNDGQGNIRFEISRR